MRLLDCFTAVTASVDQRLSLWKLSLTRCAGATYDIHITHTRSVMTDVSDVASLSVIPKRYILSVCVFSGKCLIVTSCHVTVILCRCKEDEEATVVLTGVGVQCVNMNIS